VAHPRAARAARAVFVALSVIAGAGTTRAFAQAPDTTGAVARADTFTDVHAGGMLADETSRAAAVAPLPPALAEASLHVYELVPDGSDNIRSAIDRSVAHMNFIVRPIARHRLTKANRLAEHLTFAVQPDTVAVTFDGMNPIITPRNGDSTSWIRGETGERYQVHIAPAGDTLRQVIATDDGQRENDFVFLDDGARVELHVTLTAERLPIPLRYMLLYRREY
jgi:hypothetical protein